MCTMLVDLFWTVVYLSIASLQADCIVRCGVSLKICSKLLVVVLFVLTIPFPSIPPLHHVFPNLRYRKQLSGKKMEYPSPFSIVGVYERGTTPFQVLWL